jgi:hypothetical protein
VDRRDRTAKLVPLRELPIAEDFLRTSAAATRPSSALPRRVAASSNRDIWQKNAPFCSRSHLVDHRRPE